MSFPRASLTVLAALALSIAGCLGSISDTPQHDQNVGAGTGVDDENEDGDASSAGEGDGDDQDTEGDSQGSDDGNSAPSDDEDGDNLGHADDPGVDDPPPDEADAGSDTPDEDPPADPDPPSDPDPPADTPPDNDDPAASLARGEQSFNQLCTGCHGANGKGNGGVKRSDDLAQLTDLIDGNMPLGNPGACSGTCPEDIARYILESL
jgi:hypothetical protein